MKRPENFHVLVVTYLGPTDTRGSRIRVTSERFEQSIIIPYDYSIGNGTLDIAVDWAEKAGFELAGMAEMKKTYLLISTTFKPLK